VIHPDAWDFIKKIAIAGCAFFAARFAALIYLGWDIIMGAVQ
jgi:hypothetical protein